MRIQLSSGQTVEVPDDLQGQDAIDYMEREGAKVAPSSMGRAAASSFYDTVGRRTQQAGNLLDRMGLPQAAADALKLSSAAYDQPSVWGEKYQPGSGVGHFLASTGGMLAADLPTIMAGVGGARALMGAGELATGATLLPRAGQTFLQQYPRVIGEAALAGGAIEGAGARQDTETIAGQAAVGAAEWGAGAAVLHPAFKTLGWAASKILGRLKGTPMTPEQAATDPNLPMVLDRLQKGDKEADIIIDLAQYGKDPTWRVGGGGEPPPRQIAGTQRQLPAPTPEDYMRAAANEPYREGPAGQAEMILKRRGRKPPAEMPPEDVSTPMAPVGTQGELPLTTRPRVRGGQAELPLESRTILPESGGSSVMYSRKEGKFTNRGQRTLPGLDTGTGRLPGTERVQLPTGVREPAAPPVEPGTPMESQPGLTMQYPSEINKSTILQPSSPSYTAKAHRIGQTVRYMGKDRKITGFDGVHYILDDMIKATSKDIKSSGGRRGKKATGEVPPATQEQGIPNLNDQEVAIRYGLEHPEMAEALKAKMGTGGDLAENQFIREAYQMAVRDEGLLKSLNNLFGDDPELGPLIKKAMAEGKGVTKSQGPFEKAPPLNDVEQIEVPEKIVNEIRKLGYDDTFIANLVADNGVEGANIFIAGKNAELAAKGAKRQQQLVAATQKGQKRTVTEDDLDLTEGEVLDPGAKEDLINLVDSINDAETRALAKGEAIDAAEEQAILDAAVQSGIVPVQRAAADVTGKPQSMGQALIDRLNLMKARGLAEIEPVTFTKTGKVKSRPTGGRNDATDEELLRLMEESKADMRGDLDHSDGIRRKYDEGDWDSLLKALPFLLALPAYAFLDMTDPTKADARIAFHGSKIKFPKFDLSFIGSGEGAAIKGWGIYKTEGQPVADKYYAIRLADKANKREAKKAEMTFAGDNIHTVFDVLDYSIRDSAKVLGMTSEKAASDWIMNDLGHRITRGHNLMENLLDDIQSTETIIKNLEKNGKFPDRLESYKKDYAKWTKQLSDVKAQIDNYQVWQDKGYKEGGVKIISESPYGFFFDDGTRIQDVVGGVDVTTKTLSEIKGFVKENLSEDLRANISHVNKRKQQLNDPALTAEQRESIKVEIDAALGVIDDSTKYLNMVDGIKLKGAKYTPTSYKVELPDEVKWMDLDVPLSHKHRKSIISALGKQIAEEKAKNPDLGILKKLMGDIEVDTEISKALKTEYTMYESGLLTKEESMGRIADMLEKFAETPFATYAERIPPGDAFKSEKAVLAKAAINQLYADAITGKLYYAEEAAKDAVDVKALEKLKSALEIEMGTGKTGIPHKISGYSEANIAGPEPKFVHDDVVSPYDGKVIALEGTPVDAALIQKLGDYGIERLLINTGKDGYMGYAFIEHGNMPATKVLTGNDIQETLWNAFDPRNFRGGKKPTSEFLRDKAGILGNTYIGRGSGERNYVIFDDKIPKILEVYHPWGESGGAATKLLAFMAGAGAVGGIGAYTYYKMRDFVEEQNKRADELRKQLGSLDETLPEPAAAGISGAGLSSLKSAAMGLLEKTGLFARSTNQVLEGGQEVNWKANRSQINPMSEWFIDPSRMAEKLGDDVMSWWTRLMKADNISGYNYKNHATLFRDAEGLLTKEERLRMADILEGGTAARSDGEKQAYGKIREFYDVMWNKVRESRKKVYEQNLTPEEYGFFKQVFDEGVPEARVLEGLPKEQAEVMKDIFSDFRKMQDKGKIEDYVTKHELGQYHLVEEGITTEGKAYKKIVANAVSKKDAVRKAKRYFEENPDKRSLTIDSNGMIYDLATALPRGSYYRIMNKLAKALKDDISWIEKEVGYAVGDKKDMARRAVRRAFTLKPSDKFSPFLQTRKDILHGEENIFDVLPAYAMSIERKANLDPVIAEARKLMGTINDPGGRQWMANLVEDVKGRYWTADKVVDNLLMKMNVDARPMMASRAIGKIKQGEAMLKLGYRPIASLINRLSGEGHTWVKFGTETLLEAKKWKSTPEGKAFLESVDPYMGVSYATDASGRIKPKESMLHPLGMFQAAELPNRETALSAAFLHARKNLNLPEEAAREYAIRQNWFTQFTYNAASLPRILRTPTGRLLGQFKPYLLKEFEFIKQLSGQELARYMGFQIAMGGPRGLIMVLKSLPILGTMAAWDDMELWLNKNAPRSSRGLVGGVTGMDITAAATFQVPSKFEDWIGPFISDLVKVKKEAIEPLMRGEGGVGKGIWKSAESIAPIVRYWPELLVDRVMTPGQKDFIIKDDRGREIYRLDWPDIVKEAAGAEPLESSRVRVAEGILSRRRTADNKKKQHVIDTYVKALESGNEIPPELHEEMVAIGVKPASIRREMKFRRMSPLLRQKMRTELFKRKGVEEIFPTSSD